MEASELKIQRLGVPVEEFQDVEDRCFGAQLPSGVDLPNKNGDFPELC